MPFLGTIVNFLVVLITGTLGSLLKKGIPQRMNNAIMSAMAICVIYIGLSGALEAAPAVNEGSFFSSGLVKILVMIISAGVGTLVGELIDIDKWVNKLGDALEKKLLSKSCNLHESEGKNGRGNFSRGFVSCSILFCVGAMAVNGAVADALGKPDILLAKSVIDGISCFVMAASMGIGCAFSSFLVLFYQGILTLLGLGLVSVLPSATISYMSATGSLIIVLIGTNMLGITKVKTANMIPMIFMPILVSPLFSMFS